MESDQREVILKLVMRGFLIMVFAMFSSASLVAFAFLDLSSENYKRAVIAAFMIPMLISPPISLMVGGLNYRYFLLHRRVEWLAHHDELTGILNRRAFGVAAEQKFFGIHARETSKQVALFLADIDHFKRVNDTFGHEAGDQAINHVVATLKSISPEKAMIARLGGEEFAILMHINNPLQARTLAGLICNAVERSCCVYEGTPICLTISIGVAIGSPKEGVSAMLKRADHQLYKVKSHGRNAFSLEPSLAA